MKRGAKKEGVWSVLFGTSHTYCDFAIGGPATSYAAMSLVKNDIAFIRAGNRRIAVGGGISAAAGTVCDSYAAPPTKRIYAERQAVPSDFFNNALSESFSEIKIKGGTY